MLAPHRRSHTFAFCVLLALLLFAQPSPSRTDTHAAPALVLWAWEMPEDLRTLDPQRAAVAALVDTIELTSPPRHLPRRQSLHLPPGAGFIAVVRLQVPVRAAISLSPSDYQTVLTALAGAATLHRATRLQIDFDATLSQREFYRRLLIDLRSQLPARVPLTITALGSWCMGDKWLRGLPLQEAVPMLFRMGADDRNLRAELAAGEDFREPLCRQSFGVSTDEPTPMLRPGRTIYLFNPKPWNAASIAEAEKDFAR